MNIHLLPTHSAYATTSPFVLPEGWRLYQHQLETYETVQSRRADVIVHTGLTGDGKSLAGELAALVNPRHRIIGMYPTNELVRDQKRHLNDTLLRWNADLELRELNARTLDQHSEREETDRSTSLRAFLGSADVLLTNPDIVHYIMTGRYAQGKRQPFFNIERLSEFQQFTYDEFHLFDQPQTTNILIEMIFLHQYGGNHAPLFVLQSATPENEVLEALNRGGLSIHTIEGHYLHQAGDAPSGYRTILQGVDLEIVAGSVENWLREKTDSVLSPTLQQGHQRIAVLFNSVFAALRSHEWLCATLSDYHIAHNTGLTPQSHRADSHHADVIMGTQTVDIGVDLKINQLVFEAHDAASFKQRLGRLGRHKTYRDRANMEHPFENFRAVACIPPWILAKLEEHCQPEMTREDFFAAIDDAYRSPGQVYNYNRLWGWYSAYDLCYRLGDPTIRAQNQDIQQTVATHLGQALQVGLGGKRDEYHLIKQDNQRLSAIEAFRGSSELTAVLVNNTYEGVDRYQFYDALRVVQDVEFEGCDLEQTKIEALHAGMPLKEWQRSHPIVALKWRGVVEQRRKLELSIERTDWLNVQAQVEAGEVVATTGLRLNITPTPPLGDLPVHLRRHRLVARIVLHQLPDEVRQNSRLGMFFPLFKFTTYDGIEQGTIALGRDALLLDAAMTSSLKPNGGSLIV
ncbi:MAG: hypothetical protein BroJett018_32740 [Chloroflexota bacterium]|nr:MAG: hypothetical protein BroJett018_32740 [Chloroflexota bacterium]